MLIDYLPILLLGLFAVLFAGINLALTHILGPKRPKRVKLSVYESGVQPIGDATATVYHPVRPHRDALYHL